MIGARRLSCAFILVALLAVLFVAAPASAQSWPTRAVKFILTLGPGSGADIGARLLGACPSNPGDERKESRLLPICNVVAQIGGG